eukprot:CAMPEP_0174292690 /NCGR_PEP_ID=MMETSP0809-20121228/36250_1 /TAXON_ID=73025 ORGANISM="Eutreptiella gymnastica-like, Strain CCMP1594" /NCGR_SAMPLE_ID=MMETSP0809 /ASSEMBLY_ACC=CAM_ASM_000658 /LENGTH=59 /DNA_ID=CAMNT_0015392925 /DNA_START=286 /DNA_END=462 /DNA_ORIENTATION=+
MTSACTLPLAVVEGLGLGRGALLQRGLLRLFGFFDDLVPDPLTLLGLQIKVGHWHFDSE